MIDELGIVVHLNESDPKKHAAVLRNLENMLAELAGSASVELVVHGPGLTAALSSAEHATQLSSLMKKGLAVAACENTMRKDGVTADQLVPDVITVPAGLIELARKQWDGWAYVHP